MRLYKEEIDRIGIGIGIGAGVEDDKRWGGRCDVILTWLCYIVTHVYHIKFAQPSKVNDERSNKVTNVSSRSWIYIRKIETFNNDRMLEY